MMLTPVFTAILFVKNAAGYMILNALMKKPQGSRDLKSDKKMFITAVFAAVVNKNYLNLKE